MEDNNVLIVIKNFEIIDPFKLEETENNIHWEDLPVLMCNNYNSSMQFQPTD